MDASESLFDCLDQVADPRRPRGVRHPFQAILRLTLLGLVCGQTTMAQIALFARLHWPALKEPLGFVRDHPPHATTISRALAGVPCEQLQSTLTGWVDRVVADHEVQASVDGKWAKQSGDPRGNPLVMVNALAHGLRLCLAQWPAFEKWYEPGVLREQLGPLFERYPGLRLLTMDALYAERDLRQAIADHGRDCLARIKGNRTEALAALASVNKSIIFRHTAKVKFSPLFEYFTSEKEWPGAKRRYFSLMASIWRLHGPLSGRYKAPRHIYLAVRS